MRDVGAYLLDGELGGDQRALTLLHFGIGSELAFVQAFFAVAIVLDQIGLLLAHFELTFEITFVAQQRGMLLLCRQYLLAIYIEANGLIVADDGIAELIIGILHHTQAQRLIGSKGDGLATNRQLSDSLFHTHHIVGIGGILDHSDDGAF